MWVHSRKVTTEIFISLAKTVDYVLRRVLQMLANALDTTILTSTYYSLVLCLHLELAPHHGKKLPFGHLSCGGHCIVE